VFDVQVRGGSRTDRLGGTARRRARRPGAAHVRRDRFTAFIALLEHPRGTGVVVLPDVRGVYPFHDELAPRFAEPGARRSGPTGARLSHAHNRRPGSFAEEAHLGRARWIRPVGRTAADSAISIGTGGSDGCRARTSGPLRRKREVVAVADCADAAGDRGAGARPPGADLHPVGTAGLRVRLERRSRELNRRRQVSESNYPQPSDQDGSVP
jgi:hypothetical protein